jgi:hypothetical protein
MKPTATHLLDMTPEKANELNSVYAILVEGGDEEQHEAVRTLVNILAKLVARNVRAAQAEAMKLEHLTPKFPIASPTRPRWTLWRVKPTRRLPKPSKTSSLPRPSSPMTFRQFSKGLFNRPRS